MRCLCYFVTTVNATPLFFREGNRDHTKEGMRASTRRPATDARGASGAASGGSISLLDHEETFLLIKPDASAHHQPILQAVSDTGLQVTMQSFTITSEQADVLVHMFPSVVAASGEAARVGNRSRSASVVSGGGGGDGGGGEEDGFASSRPGSMRTTTAAVNRQSTAAHNHLMNEILRLARRGGAGDVDKRNGGIATNRSDGGRVADGCDVSLGDSASDGGGESSATPAALQNVKPQKTTAPPLGGTSCGAAGAGGDYRGLVQQHTRHIVAGGTCLALLVAGPNAITTIAALVGPEDPDEARYSAPKSLRAKYGSHDVVRNAVFCTSSAADASTLIRLMFGIEGRRGATDGGGRRSLGHANRLNSGAPDITASTWMDNVSHPRGDGGNRLRLGLHHASLSGRPAEDAVSAFDAAEELLDVAVEESATGDATVFDMSAGPGGLRERVYASAPRIHMKHRTSLPDKKAPMVEQQSLEEVDGGEEDRPHHQRANQATSELARMLADERRKLIRQAKALRVREMDLVLREQDMFRTACASHSTSHYASSGGLEDGSGADLLQTSTSAHDFRRTPHPPSRHPTAPSSMAATVSFGLPCLVSMNTSSGVVPAPSSCVVPTHTIAVPPGPFLVKEDLESLVDNPQRIGYLFHRLDNKRTGLVSREAFLHMYLRSECLHVIGQEDPIGYVLGMLDRQHVPQEMPLEYFTVALMRLLQL